MTGVHNWMTGVGAGIFAYNSQIILSNTIVSSNTIYGNYGPTKYSNGGTAMFLGNPSGPCLITDSRISQNLYRFVGSGESAGYCVYGGALSIMYSPYPLTINRTLVVNNFVTNSRSMTVGKAIYAYNAPLVINSSTIADNYSTYPCAAIALNNPDTSSLVFSNSISWGNGNAFSGLVPDAFGVLFLAVVLLL